MNWDGRVKCYSSLCISLRNCSCKAVRCWHWFHPALIYLDALPQECTHEENVDCHCSAIICHKHYWEVLSGKHMKFETHLKVNLKINAICEQCFFRVCEGPLTIWTMCMSLHTMMIAFSIASSRDLLNSWIRQTFHTCTENGKLTNFSKLNCRKSVWTEMKYLNFKIYINHSAMNKVRKLYLKFW